MQHQRQKPRKLQEKPRDKQVLSDLAFFERLRPEPLNDSRLPVVQEETDSYDMKNMLSLNYSTKLLAMNSDNAASASAGRTFDPVVNASKNQSPQNQYSTMHHQEEYSRMSALYNPTRVQTTEQEKQEEGKLSARHYVAAAKPSLSMSREGTSNYLLPQPCNEESPLKKTAKKTDSETTITSQKYVFDQQQQQQQEFNNNASLKLHENFPPVITTKDFLRITNDKKPHVGFDDTQTNTPVTAREDFFFGGSVDAEDTLSEPNSNVLLKKKCRLKHFKKTKLCPYFIQGICSKKANCSFAHGLNELQPLPDLRHTKLCSSTRRKEQCMSETCLYAHSVQELKPLQYFDTYKTSTCFFWKKSKCISGQKCRFAHGEHELRSKVATTVDEPVVMNYPAVKKKVKQYGKESMAPESSSSSSSTNYTTAIQSHVFNENKHRSFSFSSSTSTQEVFALINNVFLEHPQYNSNNNNKFLLR